MEGIVAQVQSLAQGVDGETHNSILQSLRELYLSLETRQDTMQRISYAVGHCCSIFLSLQICFKRYELIELSILISST
jgi:hypothetical protein